MSCEQFPANRDLNALNPEYKDRFVRYLAALRVTFPQFQVIVTETRRSDDRQECLRKSGASQTTRSNHQDGNAVDIALLRKSTNQIDWRPAVYRNVYRALDPREYGLVSGAMLWSWDEGHLEVLGLTGQAKPKDLGKEQETYG